MNSVYHGGSANKKAFQAAGGGGPQKEYITLNYGSSDFPECEDPPITFNGRFLTPEFKYNIPSTGYHGSGYIVPLSSIKRIGILINEYYNNTGFNQVHTFKVFRYPIDGTCSNPTDPENNPFATYLCTLNVDIPYNVPAGYWYTGNIFTLNIPIPVCMLVIVGSETSFNPGPDLWLRKLTGFINLEI